MTQSALALRQFIADNKLKRDGGIIIFDASVTLYRNNKLEIFFSEIEVITLPEEMALYILAFSTTGNEENEMYRTKFHRFAILTEKELEISDEETGSRVVISLQNTDGENK